jgi:hypothetical protein
MQQDYLLGCFSFKIKHLMKRDNMNVCSWYHLLPTYESGSSKHYKVKLSRNYNLKIQQQVQPQQPPQQQQLTDVNKDIIGLTKLKFIIERNEIRNDFGFTISGSCPCIVSKVDAEKDAFSKGLRPGDYIVKIHDINVSRATCESVVKLIKNCKSKLVLEIHREKSQIKIVNKHKRHGADEITAQYINQLYFNNNSTATTDTTTSTASLSAVNTDFSGKSIDLPQYNLKLYSLNEINATKTTATTATDDSFEFCKPANVDDDEEESDNEFYSNLVPNKVEHNEIPFVDDENYSDDEDENCVNGQMMMAAVTARYSNTRVCKSRMLIKNEARNRAPLVASNNVYENILPTIDAYAVLQSKCQFI